MKQVLLRPERSGQLVKWVIDLGEHNIDYRPHASIKAQALADFLAEIPDTLRGIPTVIPIDPSEPKASKDI